MPSAVFEPAIPGNERPQTHSVDRAATGIGEHVHLHCNNPNCNANKEMLIFVLCHQMSGPRSTKCVIIFPPHFIPCDHYNFSRSSNLLHTIHCSSCMHIIWCRIRAKKNTSPCMLKNFLLLSAFFFVFLVLFLPPSQSHFLPHMYPSSYNPLDLPIPLFPLLFRILTRYFEISYRLSSLHYSLFFPYFSPSSLLFLFQYSNTNNRQFCAWKLQP